MRGFYGHVNEILCSITRGDFVKDLRDFQMFYKNISPFVQFIHLRFMKYIQIYDFSSFFSDCQLKLQY